MDERADPLLRPTIAVRLGLAAFVLAWLLGPSWLQSHVPVLLVFLLALGLEVQFFVSARRARPPLRRDRGPQDVDRERYGYSSATDELLVIRDGGEELWLPYSGESGEELAELIARAREEDEEGDEEEWEPEPPPAEPPRRRPVRGFLTGLGVIGVLALAIWAVEARSGWSGLDADTRTQAEEVFSAEASRLAEKPVRIHCDEEGRHVGVVQHADGAAVVGGDVAYLAPERCYDLYRLAFRGEVKGSQTGRAIAVLAHEVWHLRGVRDEGTTECYALQSGVLLGQRLGLTEETARQLMRQRLAENVLHARSTPEYIVPPACRAGGELDLNPESNVFP